MDIYCKKVKIDDAMHVFREMWLHIPVYYMGCFLGVKFPLQWNELQAVGLEPTFHTYCILLDGLCKNGHTEHALLLLKALEDKEEHLHVSYYSIVMDGPCEADQLLNAQTIFDNLRSKGLEPNVVTYTILMKGYCQNGLVGEARDLFLKMEQTSLSPNEITYNTIVHGLLVNSHYDDAPKFLEKMRCRGFKPDSYTLFLLIELLGTKEQNPIIFKMIQKFAPCTLKQTV